MRASPVLRVNRGRLSDGHQTVGFAPHVMKADRLAPERTTDALPNRFQLRISTIGERRAVFQEAIHGVVVILAHDDGVAHDIIVAREFDDLKMIAVQP